MNEKKPEWLARVKETHRFHIQHIKDNPKHTIADTCKLLKRSIGSVSQELKVASWLRTHSAQLEEFEFFHQAIEYIRQRKHKLLTEELDDD